MKIGNNEIQKIYVGSVEITKAYAGSDLVYENTPTPTGYTLPDVSYLCNYNAVDFDDDLQTFYRSENTQSLNKDLTRTYGSGTLALDGRKVAINSNWSSAISYANASGNPFNINSNNQDLTVIYKAAPKSGTYDNQNNIIGNRGSNTTYNWMVRVMSFHNSVGEQMQFTPSVSPQTIVIRVHNGDGERYCVESEQIATQTGMDFSKQAASVGFFAGFGNAFTEPFKGDFYWLYVSREVLTDAQVQQVIDYNEHKEHIEPDPSEFLTKYFTVKALASGNITWAPSGTVEYSVNEGTWNTWDNTNGLAVSTNDEVRFRSTANTNYNGKTLRVSGNYKVEGNIMSLLYGDNFSGQTTISTDLAFSGLLAGPNAYQNNTTLLSAKNLVLPATTLSTQCYSMMFRNATNLKSCPMELPATTLPNYAYSEMFLKCSSLTSTPIISATTFGSYSCKQMFANCTSLTTAPELTVNTLSADYALNGLFSGCTSLSSISNIHLNATTLKNNCYASMFVGCKNLRTTIDLPATTLTNNCYQQMFMNCSGLTSTMVLSATTLANNCYTSMFEGCKGLTQAPELPATTLKSSCYSNMFAGCTSLTSTPTISATTMASSACTAMFSGCTSLTTAQVPSATNLSIGCYNGMFKGCTSLTTAPALPATAIATRCYSGMFEGCTGLNVAPTLSVTYLLQGCYVNMFKGCTSLTTAPALPATGFAGPDVYWSMFEGCTSLTTAPELSATTLTNNCYKAMFSGCTNLSYVKCLATNISATDCTTNWLNGVSATGTFVKDPGMSSWTAGASGIPSGWTIQN